MPTPTAITLSCPAKVNLALSVGASDPAKNNMHPIASWMLALAFSDTLTLNATHSQSYPDANPDADPGKFEIRFDCSVRHQQVDWPLEKDLAYRALQLMRQWTNKALPVDVQLVKHIPTGAGLGGGSSNAAGMLVGLNKLFDLQLGQSTLLNLASQLGSDVVFLTQAILGQGSCLVTGMGQHVQPIAPPQPPIHLVLIFPPFGCETKAVYHQFDLLDSPNPQADIQKVKGLTALSPLSADAPFNDLATPACLAQPQLAKIQIDLAKQLNTPIHITGSGSTLYAIAATGQSAQAWASQITQLTQLPALATSSLPN